MVRLAVEDKRIQLIFGRRLPQVSIVLIPSFIWQDWHLILSYLACVPLEVFLLAACLVSPSPHPLQIPCPTGLSFLCAGHSEESGPGIHLQVELWGHRVGPIPTSELLLKYFQRVCFFTSLLILLCMFRCFDCCHSSRYEISHCFNLHFLDYYCV